MIAGLLLCIMFMWIYLAAQKRKNLYGSKIVLAGSYSMDKDWLVKFAESSSRQFALAGSIGVLGYWLKLDWGAYAPLVVMAISMAIDKIKKYQDNEEDD